MAAPRHSDKSDLEAVGNDDESVLGTGLSVCVFSSYIYIYTQFLNKVGFRIVDSIVLQTRQIEAFGRKVTTTAGHLINSAGDPTTSSHYQHAMTEIQRELRKPRVQRRMFSYAQTTPSDLVRSKFSTSEIQYRALTTLPDELLAHIPEDTSTYSLFQGFQASLPEEEEHRKSHRRWNSRGQRLLDGEGGDAGSPVTPDSLRHDRDVLNRRLDMMGVRKNMCSAEIREIDTKIANLNQMRKIVLDRLAGLEMDEAELEHECEARLNYI